MSSTKEEEILAKIENVDFDLSIVRAKVKITKQELTELETDLIGLKLSREKLTDDLKRFRSMKVHNENF